jgi:hypothetical protein
MKGLKDRWIFKDSEAFCAPSHTPLTHLVWPPMSVYGCRKSSDDTQPHRSAGHQPGSEQVSNKVPNKFRTSASLSGEVVLLGLTGVLAGPPQDQANQLRCWGGVLVGSPVDSLQIHSAHRSHSPRSQREEKNIQSILESPSALRLFEYSNLFGSSPKRFEGLCGSSNPGLCMRKGRRPKRAKCTLPLPVLATPMQSRPPMITGNACRRRLDPRCDENSSSARGGLIRIASDQAVQNRHHDFRCEKSPMTPRLISQASIRQLSIFHACLESFNFSCIHQ